MVKHLIDNPPKASGMQKHMSPDSDPDKFDSSDALRTQLKFARREIDQLKNQLEAKNQSAKTMKEENLKMKNENAELKREI